MKRVLAIGIGLTSVGLLTGCATEAELAGIAAKAKIPQECRFVGETPQISKLGTKKNLDNVVEAMGGGNVIVETGGRYYQGLMALANTWWGNLYDCDNPTLYHGDGIRILSPHSAHPVNAQIKEASGGVRVTSNTDTVRGCQFLANVNDLTAGELTRGPYTVRQAVLKYNTATLSGNTVLLSSDPHTGEAYKCAAPATPAAPVTEGQSPVLVESTTAKVRLVKTNDEVFGCTFVADTDAQMRCQAPYEERSACIAWQAATRYGGNTVLVEGDVGHVYRCNGRAK